MKHNAKHTVVLDRLVIFAVLIVNNILESLRLVIPGADLPLNRNLFRINQDIFHAQVHRKILVIEYPGMISAAHIGAVKVYLISKTVKLQISPANLTPDLISFIIQLRRTVIIARTLLHIYSSRRFSAAP